MNPWFNLTLRKYWSLLSRFSVLYRLDSNHITSATLPTFASVFYCYVLSKSKSPSFMRQGTGSLLDWGKWTVGTMFMDWLPKRRERTQVSPPPTFKKYFIYLRERKRAGGGAEWEIDSPLSRDLPSHSSPPHTMWGSVPGPWDHDLSWRQMLNLLRHPGAPPLLFFEKRIVGLNLEIQFSL